MSRVVFNPLSFTKTMNKIVDGVVKTISDQLFQDIKRRSPVRSGLFQRSWRKSGRGKQYRITNPQPYGGKLEAGASRQAPDGVMAPARKNLNPNFRRYER